MSLDTRRLLLRRGMDMLLERGFNGVGINDVLVATGVPKGSFYHHFRSKEEFGLQAIDLYMEEVHAGLDQCLGDRTRPPLLRVRRFFELSAEKYRREGYLGCLLGGLGQELSGVSEPFRRKVEACFTHIAGRIAATLAEAVERGELPADTDPDRMAGLLINCWEGAALRTRLRRSAAPLHDMLDFYFRMASGHPQAASPQPTRQSTRAARKTGGHDGGVPAARSTGGDRRRRRATAHAGDRR